MARPLKPFIRGGGYYPSNKWTPLVYNGGYTTMNGGEEPEPPTPVYWKTITGASPLALAKALAHSIKSLTQYGLCTQSTTPTPSAPVDIVCNNGALTMVDDELPAAYKRVLGFSMNNDTYWEITGFKLRGSDTIRFSFSASTACNVLGCYNGTSATNNYSLYTVTTSGGYLRYGNATYNSVIVVDKRYDVVLTPTGSHGMENDSTWTAKTFTSTNDMCIGTTSTTATSSKMVGSLFGDVIVDGRLHLVPCERVSDNALGYYDTIGEAFYEQASGYRGAVSLGYDGSQYSITVVGTPETLTVAPAGSATQAETPTPDNPVPVVGTVCGNTVLYAVGDDADTYDPITNTITRRVGSYVLDGTESFGKSTAYGTAWYINAASSAWGADRNKTVLCTHFESGEASSSSPDGSCFFNTTGHFYFRASEFADAAAFKAWVKGQYDAGTPVVVYFVKSTPATEAYTGTPVGEVVNDVPTLLSVGDYADEDEIIGGAVTYKVGIRILTGEENGWALSDSGTTHRFRGTKPSDCHTPASRAPSVCTHFKYVSTGSALGGMFIGASQYWYFIPTDQTIDTVEKWTAWLASQYAAGTPVIVVYPLAEETTDSVTPQTISTSEGDNVMIVTSNVDPVTLEVEYASSEEE